MHVYVLPLFFLRSGQAHLSDVEHDLVLRDRQDVEHELRPEPVLPNHLFYCRPGSRAVRAR